MYSELSTLDKLLLGLLVTGAVGIGVLGWGVLQLRSTLRKVADALRTARNTRRGKECQECQDEVEQAIRPLKELLRERTDEAD